MTNDMNDISFLKSLGHYFVAGAIVVQPVLGGYDWAKTTTKPIDNSRNQNDRSSHEVPYDGPAGVPGLTLVTTSTTATDGTLVQRRYLSVAQPDPIPESPVKQTFRI